MRFNLVNRYFNLGVYETIKMFNTHKTVVIAEEYLLRKTHNNKQQIFNRNFIYKIYRIFCWSFGECF